MSTDSVEGTVPPLGFDDLRGARVAYGHGTAPWSAPGYLEVSEDWWIALSLTHYVDYNLALIHGPGGVEAAPQVIEKITGRRLPSVIMLAGAGLGAADALRDAGWVCTGALPFMARWSGPISQDPVVRPLGPDDLSAARDLAASAFGVPTEVGAIVYGEGALDNPRTHAYGLFEDGRMRCCSLIGWVDNTYSVGWGLSTAPEDQRSGFGRRLMRASNFHRVTSGGPTHALLTATTAGEHLYQQEGYNTLEYWQT